MKKYLMVVLFLNLILLNNSVIAQDGDPIHLTYTEIEANFSEEDYTNFNQAGNNTYQFLFEEGHSERYAIDKKIKTLIEKSRDQSRIVYVQFNEKVIIKIFPTIYLNSETLKSPTTEKWKYISKSEFNALKIK
jgi:hypothetical protein